MKKNFPNKYQKHLNEKIPQTEKKIKNYKKKFYQDQKEKSPHRQSSRLRNQPRKDYNLFIPQSQILKKVEFQKPL